MADSDLTTADDRTVPIRKLPAQSERVETGPVQFGDDWPGVFIRGDSAFYFAMTLRRVLEHGPEVDPFALLAVRGLLDALTGSDLTGISRRPSVPAQQDKQD